MRNKQIEEFERRRNKSNHSKPKQTKKENNSLFWGIIIGLPILLIMAGSLGNTNVDVDLCSEYRVGFVNANLYPSGITSFYKEESKYRSCNTRGSWRKEGEKIYVYGLHSSNCPEMSNYNGRYLIEGCRLVGPR
jgi:hypothetical protein